MDDGVTETDDFRTLWQCLESEIEHYEDILKAKLVSYFCNWLTIPLATAVSLICNLVNYFSQLHQACIRLVSFLQLLFTILCNCSVSYLQLGA